MLKFQHFCCTKRYAGSGSRAPARRGADRGGGGASRSVIGNSRKYSGTLPNSHYRTGFQIPLERRMQQIDKGVIRYPDISL